MPCTRVDVSEAYMPGKENGVWDYYNYTPWTLNRQKFDEFKNRFYKLQGWDVESGYPTKAILASVGPGYVSDVLEKNGKFGRS